MSVGSVLPAVAQLPLGARAARGVLPVAQAVHSGRCDGHGDAV